MAEHAGKPKVRFAGFTEDWEQRKLGEIGKAYSGVGFPDSEQGGTEGIPFFKVSDMNSIGNENELQNANNYVDIFQISRHKWKPITEVPAIFFAKVGAAVMLNRKRLVQYPFLLDNNTMAYSFEKGIWNISFGKSLFETIDLTSLVQVGALPSYNASDVEDIKIFLPSLPEQARIGTFFRQLDRLITLHQRKRGRLENIKKAMLEKMFPKNGADVPEVRFAGFTEAWEQRKVGEYYDFKNGLNKGKEYFGIGTPIVNFTDVFHLRGIYEKDLKGKVSLTRAEIANFQVKMGDIFFTRTSETIDEIGFPSVMLDEPKDTVFSGFVLRGRALQDDPLTLQFKRYVFFTDAFRKEMVKKSSITTRALTSGTAIKNMEFVFPKNKKEQEFIGNFFRHLDRLITLHQRKVALLQNIKKACLEKMFV